MDKLSMSIIAMEAHVACSNDRLRQAWEIIHAKLVEENGNSLQQLQAKIRAVADKLFVCHFQSGSGGLDNLALINELRELSAMQ